MTVGILLSFTSCTGGDKPSEGGAAGQATTGGAGAEGDRGGSANGGKTTGGSAGDDSGGASGMSQGGSSGGQGGSGAGQDGNAGDGGQDTDGGTVTGVVLTDYGSPNPNVLVAIGSATTYTDAEGRFEIPDVAPEYDIAVIAPTESYVLVIRDIGARTLSLRAPGHDDGSGANLTGIVTGGAGLPIPKDCFARAAYQGSSTDVFALFGPEAPLLESDASYSMDLFWFGNLSATGSLFALEFRVDATNRVVSYDGFGSTPLDLSDGGMYGTPATTVSLAPVDSRTVSGTVTIPSGYLPRVYVDVGPFRVDLVEFPEGTYSTVLPTGTAELKNTVTLHALRDTEFDDEEASTATYIVDDSVTTLDLSTPVAPVTILPAPATAGVDYATEFSWSAPADSVSVLMFAFDRWTVHVVTEASSVTIPDLTEHGVTHAPGAGAGFTVDSHVGPTSVEEWVAYTADYAGYLRAHGRVGRAVGSYLGFTLAE